eukprot:34402-Eustigmatos_ZCMA.PRE.1
MHHRRTGQFVPTPELPRTVSMQHSAQPNSIQPHAALAQHVQLMEPGVDTQQAEEEALAAQHAQMALDNRIEFRRHGDHRDL